MAAEVEINVELLKREIKKTYARVSEQPEDDFIFPTGRVWAEDLDYPPELANVPDAAVESFAGIANPWGPGRLAPGERVLDLGSGTGTDSLVAAHMIGAQGYVTGIDMTPEMLAKARVAAAQSAATPRSSVVGTKHSRRRSLWGRKSRLMQFGACTSPRRPRCRARCRKTSPKDDSPKSWRSQVQSPASGKSTAFRKLDKCPRPTESRSVSTRPATLA
jgi:hypothetical protein